MDINAELDFTKTKVEILQLREKIMAPVVHHACERISEVMNTVVFLYMHNVIAFSL